MAKYALLDKSGKTRLTTEANTAREAGKGFIRRREAPLPEGWTIVKREEKPTTKPTAPEFKVGDRVRVKARVGQPKHGWGYVKHGDVGIVRSIEGGKLRIDFPAQVHWHGVPPEMELAPKKAEPKKLAPSHFELKMDSGEFLSVKKLQR